MSRSMGAASQAAIFLLLATLCRGAPSHYFTMHNVQHLWSFGAAAPGGQEGRAWGRRLTATDSNAIDCGTPPGEKDRPDPMYFTQSGCSLSSMDGQAYLDSSGTFRNASKGDLIQVRLAAGQLLGGAGGGY